MAEEKKEATGVVLKPGRDPFNPNRLALFRKRDGSFLIEPEVWTGQAQVNSDARKRGLMRIAGHEKREVLEAAKAALENARS